MVVAGDARAFMAAYPAVAAAGLRPARLGRAAAAGQRQGAHEIAQVPAAACLPAPSPSLSLTAYTFPSAREFTIVSFEISFADPSPLTLQSQFV